MAQSKTQNHDSILQAARLEFLEKGFQDTSMRAIARLSGKYLRLSQPATQLDLLDMQGRKLLSARGVQEARIDVPTGIYLLRSIFPTTTFICKLIVR